jgi:RNA polymerase sigma-70 factor (ECF subfamily)
MNIDPIDLRVLLASDIQQGFARLVDAYQHQLYAFLLRRSGNPQEAEDFVQETFLRSYYTLKRYSAERIQALALRPWLYKIASNAFISSLRQLKPSLISLEVVDDASWLEPADETTQPERLLEELEERQELEMLIRGLPSQYAETMMLYYFEHFSYQEIAYILNSSPATIRSYRHRSIQLLRKALLKQRTAERGKQIYGA